jgi:4-hydroxy-2-oxoheptanedioate aldolase
VTETTRLNGIIRAWEEGLPAHAVWAQAERQVAIETSQSPYDCVVFEMEHNAWDANALQDALQYLLNRKQVHQMGSLAPAITPIVRIPANGSENNQWLAKQALDRGVYGVIWPHVNTVEQALNAVSACRYPRPHSAAQSAPAGARGDGPHVASRYWGLSQQEYYTRADVWPLNLQGELLVFLMIEDVQGIENLDDILRNVPGIGCVLIGEGDLSQELGVPRQYEHPIVVDAMAKIVTICKRNDVRVGHPHVTAKNVEAVIAQGYTFLMSAPVKSHPVVDSARALTRGSIK